MARARKPKPVVDPDGDARVSSIAKALLGLVDDLKRKMCPACGHPNLHPQIGPNSVAITCKTPMEHDLDIEGEFVLCTYSKLVHLTDITTGVFALQFAEPFVRPQPATPIKKPATRRRRTV